MVQVSGDLLERGKAGAYRFLNRLSRIGLLELCFVEELFVHHCRTLQLRRVGTKRKPRDHADSHIPERSVEPLRGIARRVEREQSAMRGARLLFDREHERSRNTRATAGRMNQQFLDFATMRLIRRRSKIELDSTNDPPVTTRDDYATLSSLNCGQHSVAPEGRGIVTRKRQDETHGGACVNTIVQQFSERGDVVTDVALTRLPEFDANRLRIHRIN